MCVPLFGFPRVAVAWRDIDIHRQDRPREPEEVLLWESFRRVRSASKMWHYGMAWLALLAANMGSER